MKTKADIVMPEFLKIILAVVCIVLLVFLAANLYGIIIKKTDIEQARATLNDIVEKVNSFEDEKVTETDYLIVSPKDWTLLHIEKKESSGKCKTDNCLCFCKNEEYDKKINGGIYFTIACSSLGICMETKIEIVGGEINTNEVPRNVVFKREGDSVDMSMG